MDYLGGKIRPMYFKLFITAIGSTIIMSIYSTVDMIAVGQYAGPAGSAALACINPMWSVIFALGLLFGIGGSVMMGNQRGAGNRAAGNEFFTVSVLAGAVISLLLLGALQLWSRPVLAFFGADEEVLPYAMSYFQWIAWAAPFFLLSAMLNDFIRNDGAPAVCTAAVVIGGVLNMLGDYLLVFVADMGLSGAGLATAVGQTVSFLISASYLLRRRCGLRFVRVQDLGKKLRQVVSVGFSPFIVDLTFGVVVIFFNRQIGRLAGNTELAVYGTVANLGITVQVLFYAVGNSLQPLVATNFGARQTDRVHQTLRISLGVVAVMGVLFFALAELLPLPILRLYMAVSDEVVRVGPRILCIYAVNFLFMGFNVMATYYLQSILRSRQALTISLLRGFFLSTALVFALPAIFGFDAIWWTMPLTEAVTMIVTVLFLRRPVKA